MSAKTIRTIRIILIIIGAAFFAYGIAVLSIIGGGSRFNYIFTVMGLAMFALCPALNLLRGRSKTTLIIIASLIFLLLFNFCLFEAKLIHAANNQYRAGSESEPKWVIVLGAKVNANKSPGLEFSKRLQKAEELCSKDSTLILTGGKGADEPYSEAEGAYDFLKKRGKIKAKEIILETESTSTTENLINAGKIIEARGGSKADKVLIISSEFHLYRAGHIAKLAGFSNTRFAGSSGLTILKPYFYFREYAAYVREFVL